MRAQSWIAVLWGLSGCHQDPTSTAPPDGGAVDAGSPSDLGPVAAWQRVLSLDPVAARAIGGFGPTDVYVGYDQHGGIARSLDGGQTWTSQQLAQSDDQMIFNAVWANSRDEVFIGGELRRANDTTHPLYLLYGSIDRGSSWQPLPVPVEAGSITGLWGSGHELYAAGGSLLLHSTNDGVTFARATFNDFTANGVWGNNSGDVLLAGGHAPSFDGGLPDAAAPWLGLLMHSTDHGASWQPASGGTGSGPLNAISGAADGYISAVGSGGSLLRSFDWGVTWSQFCCFENLNTAGYDFRAVWQPANDRPFIASVGLGAVRDIETDMAKGTIGTESEIVPGASEAIVGVWGTEQAVFALGSGGVYRRALLPYGP